MYLDQHHHCHVKNRTRNETSEENLY